jgi:hypothetical protein
MSARLLKNPAALLVLCALSPLACGSDSPGGPSGVLPACTPFTTCGGDLSGKWKVVESCPTVVGAKKVTDKLKFCAAATVTLDSAKITGAVEYDKQGTLKNDVTFDLRISTTFPGSCVPAGSTCATTHPAPPTGATMDMACVTMGTDCSCHYRWMGLQNQENSYETKGTTVTETDVSDGSMLTSQYCVSGGVLRIQNEDETDVFIR